MNVMLEADGERFFADGTVGTYSDACTFPI